MFYLLDMFFFWFVTIIYFSTVNGEEVTTTTTTTITTTTTTTTTTTEDELCVLNSCEVDANCTGSNVCIYHSCAIDQGMVDDGCPCETDSDCKSKDCVIVDLFSLDFRCTITSSSGNNNNEGGNGDENEQDDDNEDTTTEEGWPILDLNKNNILYKSAVAANLSALAIDRSSPELWISNDTISGFFHPDYETISFFKTHDENNNDESDNNDNNNNYQVIVAKKDGICYLALGYTNTNDYTNNTNNPNRENWVQNLINNNYTYSSNNNGVDTTIIYRDNDDTTNDSCTAREDFAAVLFSRAAAQGLIALEQCLAECSSAASASAASAANKSNNNNNNHGDCLVITGHSQEGASASLAAILLHQYDPTIITFGQPPAAFIESDSGNNENGNDNGRCEWINSKKYYRYVNSREIQMDDSNTTAVNNNNNNDNRIGFDIVTTIPPGNGYYGYYILLGESKKAVKYLGFDEDYNFVVVSSDDITQSAHFMDDGEPYSYRRRILNLLEEQNISPISIIGFEEGHICESEYAKICASGFCGVDDRCTATNPNDDDEESGGTTGEQLLLCVDNSCLKNSDCVGDDNHVCIYNSCAAGPGMVENGCPCLVDRNCKSNSCIADQPFSLNFRCSSTAPTSSSSSSASLFSLSLAGTFPRVSPFLGGNLAMMMIIVITTTTSSAAAAAAWMLLGTLI